MWRGCVWTPRGSKEYSCGPESWPSSCLRYFMILTWGCRLWPLCTLSSLRWTWQERCIYLFFWSWSSEIDIIGDVCNIFQVSQQTFQWMEARMAAVLVGVRRQLLLMYKFSKRYAANLPDTWPISVCYIGAQQVFSLNLAGVFWSLLVCLGCQIINLSVC